MEDLSLSTQALIQIQLLDHENERDYPSAEDQQMLQVIRYIAKSLVKSRESFTDIDISLIEKVVQSDPEFFKRQIDDQLTRFLLENVPDMAARVMKLSALASAPSHSPSKTTAIYLSEAFRAYVYGLDQSSAAMSRAALEQALKEKLKRQSGGKFTNFQDLVTEAQQSKISILC